MRLTGMNQLAVAVKESLETLVINNDTEDDDKASSIQNRYVDSVEFSDMAIELSMEADTETGFNEESDTDQGQEGNPDTNQRQEPAFTEAVPLNVLA